MPADEIDDAMVRFADGEGDVLLATNIVESGLDVPRANTMLVWRPDRFGLAQLHQLRGRVGRGGLRGIAYLLTDPAQALARSTRKRLETLESLDRLGAGFAISARDLDQRGAGDLFGADQAGHVKLIGVSLYQHLLSRALAEASGKEQPDENRIDINIDAGGHIPDTYVPEAEVRINLYAQLARLESEVDVDAFEEEVRNRFGEPPGPVARLVALARLRAHGRALAVGRIDAGPQAVALTFTELRGPAWIETAVARSNGALAWRNGRLVWKHAAETPEDRLAAAERLFGFLAKVERSR
jgi:transcription-repair coupling factor (superfamily II helicase)